MSDSRSEQTAKHLYLVRHGEAQSHGGGVDDYDRVLTPRGIEEARQAGNWLLEQFGGTPAIFTSSAASRALQTARLAAEVCGVDGDSIANSRKIYDADFPFITDLILSSDEATDHLVLAGHNPTLYLLAQYLATNGPGDLSTGGIIHIVFDVPDWASAVVGQVQTIFTPTR